MQRTLYIIATTSRSGSTHLCRLLKSTARLAHPGEFYKEGSRARRMKNWNVSDGWEFFQYVVERTSTPNGVCGMKLPTTAFQTLRRELGCVFELLRPKYIWLRRRDTLQQAISLYRATESDVWQWRTDQAKPPACPPFNAEKINACRRQIEQANDTWANWLAADGFQPLEIWYEDLVANPKAVVQSICRHVGVDDKGLLPVQSDLRVMRDAVTEEWMARLRAKDENMTTPHSAVAIES